MVPFPAYSDAAWRQSENDSDGSWRFLCRMSGNGR